MLHQQKLLSAADLEAIQGGLTALAEEHARGLWHVELADEDGQTALERRLTERIGPAGGRSASGPLAQRSGADGAATVSARCRRGARAAALSTWPTRSDALAARESDTALPGYTHMQQAMPSSVPLWAGGFAAEIRDDAHGLQQVQRRVGKSRWVRRPATARPGLPLDRDATREQLGFAEVHEPVTAVQLSRGKAEAQLLFEIAPADAGPRPLRRRRAAVLHPGVRLRRAAGCLHHRLLDHAAEAQPGRVRADPRPHRHRAGVPDRSARHLRQAALRLSARPAAAESRRCSAASTSPQQTLDILPAAIDADALPAGKHHISIPRSTPPRKPTGWW